MIRAALPTFAALFAGSTALACGFHGFGPLPSMVEQMLASEHIVLARSDPENAFRYQAVESIEGGLEYVEIPFLVDSATRRRLQAEPEARVLFARDGAYGPWMRLTYVDEQMRPVIDRIADRLPDWEMGADEERFALFAGLLDHSSPAVHDLALRELDQADYGQLRAALGEIDADRLLARIDRPSETDLKPIRVLLLGLSGDAGAAPLLASGMAAQVGIEGQLLGAYATAHVELNGPTAAGSLAETYLSDTNLPPASRELLVEALALHALTGTPEMQDAVRGAIEATLRDHPELAPAVARQFGARGDWSFAPAVRAAMAAGPVSALDTIAIAQYISLAEGEGPSLSDLPLAEEMGQ